MQPVPQTRLDEILRPIFAERIREANLDGRTDVEYLFTQLNAGYAARTDAAFVDSLEDPKTALVIGVRAMSLFKGVHAIVHLFWMREDCRGKFPRELADMLKTVNDFATQHTADAIIAESWCYLDSEPQIDALWEADEFELQSRVFVKLT